MWSSSVCSTTREPVNQPESHERNTDASLAWKFGAVRVVSSYRIQPNDHMSAFVSYDLCARISGAIYAGVPTFEYARSRVRSKIFDIPKSPIFIWVWAKKGQGS